MEGSTNWAALPEEALRRISSSFTDPQDFIRFRAVCMNWNQLVPRHAHGRFGPWIVGKLGKEDEDSGFILFYKLASERFHLFHVEPQQGKRLAGYDSGLLLGIDKEDELSVVLVNPLTGECTHLPRLPACFHGTFTYCFAIDPLITGEEDVYVLVYNWPTLERRSNVALWRRGGASVWATIPSQHFWMGMPGHRNLLLNHGPGVLQLEQAVAPDDMAWVPGMEDVHAVEHQGQVRLLARQELIMDDGSTRRAPHPIARTPPA
jgi:hypothetical protein